MKSKKLMFTVMTVGVLAWPMGQALAESMGQDIPAATEQVSQKVSAASEVKVADTQAAAQESVTGPVEVGNKFCPISGEKVGEMGKVVKFEYKGKIYNFCCPMCLKDFNKDPEKYVQALEEKMKMEATQQSAETPAGK